MYVFFSKSKTLINKMMGCVALKKRTKNLALALEERARSWTTSSALICNDCV